VQSPRWDESGMVRDESGIGRDESATPWDESAAEDAAARMFNQATIASAIALPDTAGSVTP